LFAWRNASPKYRMADYVVFGGAIVVAMRFAGAETHPT
jgi:hypothetical protein